MILQVLTDTAVLCPLVLVGLAFVFIVASWWND